MNIFLCHTPLHVLISALEAPKHRDTETLFIIIEDSYGIHALASAILESPNTSFILLSGTASTSSSKEAIEIQKANQQKIRAIISKQSVDHIFIFFDQRVEAQALLNYHFSNKPIFSWLEDGITTYNVATPFAKPLRRLIKHKLRFDLAWKGSKWLGQHPMFEEICCFFPDALRNNLKDKTIRSLPRTLEESYCSAFLKFYGNERFSNRTGIIVVPHHDSGVSRKDIDTFISKSIYYIRSKDALPILKFHPRDEVTMARILGQNQDVQIMQQYLPIELVLLAEKNITVVTGYRTSALHVTSALFPNISILYYESPHAADSKKWREFFIRTSVHPLT